MKFLLAAINAKYIHSNPAVYSLKACAGEYKAAVEIAEFTINQPLEAILAGIYEKRPDAIGFSCYIWNWRIVQELLVELPKLLPQVPIWLGGPEISYDGPKLLEQFPCLSGLMVGEGEDTFRELLAFYGGRGGKLANIAGLCLLQGYTRTRPPVDLDSIPFLYEDMAFFQNRILYYESSRGCPFRCSYCLSSIDKSVRFRSMEKVLPELQHFLNAGVKQVKFIDRTFNCRHEHAFTIWKYLHEHDNGVTNFHFEVAADIMDERELELLGRMRPGLVQLEIGVQSTNPRTLQEIRRATDLNRLREAVDRVREGKNIHQHLDLIAGLPFEDAQSFRKSFNDIYVMNPQQLQLGFLKVLKGSYLHEMAEEYKIVYRSRPPYEALCSKWISYDEMLLLKKVEEMVELYYNSGQFRHTLSVLEQEFLDAFSLYEALALYYEKRGFFTNSPSRMYRYEILFRFAEERFFERKELYRELLTYDLYLRERLKSRPSFLRDLLPWREELHRQQTEKTGHVEVFYYRIWEAERWRIKEAEPQAGTEPCYVRFSYEEKDPLTKEARIYV